jgi:hypothetical protein
VSLDFNRLSQVNISKAYLGDSQLIRKAENPFAFLTGREKMLSLMVRSLALSLYFSNFLPKITFLTYFLFCIMSVFAL